MLYTNAEGSYFECQRTLTVRNLVCRLILTEEELACEWSTQDCVDETVQLMCCIVSLVEIYIDPPIEARLPNTKYSAYFSRTLGLSAQHGAWVVFALGAGM